MAKYMLIMRGTDESNANLANADFTELLETMGKFNDELIRAGVLLAAEGLDDPSGGVVELLRLGLAQLGRCHRARRGCRGPLRHDGGAPRRARGEDAGQAEQGACRRVRELPRRARLSTI